MIRVGLLLMLCILLDVHYTKAQNPELRFPLNTSKGFRSLEFSADGKKVLAATGKDVRIWDVASGLMVNSKMLEKFIVGAEYIPQNSGIIIHSNKQADGQVFHWDGKSKEIEIKTEEGWFGFSASGKRSYFRLNDMLNAWDQEIQSFRDFEINIRGSEGYPSPIEDNEVYLVDNSNYRATGSADSAQITLLTVEPANRAPLTKVQGIIKEIYWVKKKQEALVQLESKVEGQTLQTFQLLDYREGQWGQKVAEIEAADITQVHISPDGSRVYILTDTRQQFSLDFNQNTIIQQISPVPVSKPDFDIPASFWTKAFKFTTDGQLLGVFPASRERAEVWNIWKRKKLWDLKFRIKEPEEYMAPSEQLTFSPDGQYLLHGNETGQIQLLQSATGALVQAFNSGIMHRVNNLEFADNYKLHILTTDTTIWQFDLNTVSFASIARSKVFNTPKNQLNPTISNLEEVYSLDSSLHAQWPNTVDVRYNSGLTITENSSGKVIKIPPANNSSLTTTASFSPDNSLVIIGTQDNIIRIARTADGAIQHTFRGHQTEILDLAISKNKRVAASLSKDQSEIKLWDLEKGVELASIFLFGQQDYAIISPNGIFDASPGTMRHLYFVVGDEIIDLEQLKELYWAPNLLKKLLAGKSPREIRDVRGNALDEFYPLTTARIDKDQLLINIEKRKGGLGPLHLYINGTLVNKNLNRRQENQLEIPLERYAKHFYTQRPNSISLQSFNKREWMKSRPIKLPPYTPSFPIERDHKLAHLYAIVVGTSEYEGDELDLSYAGKDAVSIHKALTIAGKDLFEDRTDIRLFTTDTAPEADLPTKNNIQKAIAEITTKAEPIDLVLIYFAGHGKAVEGKNNKSHFYYLTQSMRSFRQLENPQARRLDAISQEEITDWLSEMAAKKRVLILDACNSGEMVNALVEDRDFTESQLVALDRLKDKTGMYILAGSAADRESFEATPFGQGLLTYSLLQGMKELSVKDQNKEVDVLQLLMYAENQVPKLAQSVGKIQRPKMYNQDGLSSFPIGIVQNPEAIPVAQVKPLLIRPAFFQEGSIEDDLDLTPELENHINNLIRQGGNFVFQDVRTSAQGYSIRGTYRINGDKISVNGYLRKGTKKVDGVSFEIKGAKQDIPGLAEAIFTELEFLGVLKMNQ